MAATCGVQDYKKNPYICSFQTNYGFYASFWGFQTNLAGNLHFRQLILAGGHLFLKLFQLASQKWLPKSQIGWENVPTLPIFLEPLSQLYDSATVRLYDSRMVLKCTCTTVHLYDCTTVQLYNCTAVQLYNSTTVRLYNCTTVQLYNCTTVQLYNCTTVINLRKVTIYPNNSEILTRRHSMTRFVPISITC